MKMKKLLVCITVIFFTGKINAQTLKSDTGALIRKIETSPGNFVYLSSYKGFPMMGNKSYKDRLLTTIHDYLYKGFYDDPGHLMSKTPCRTFLKVDIDKKGNVISMEFSDSATIDIVNTWHYLMNKKSILPILTEYIRVQEYKNLSLFFPILYEPNTLGKKEQYTYQQADAILKFGTKDFTGLSVILSPIFIPVLSDHNF